MTGSGDTENSSTTTEESEHMPSYICSSCDMDGEKLKAVGYCVNCREYLCRRCFDAHLIPTALRRHKLLDEEGLGEVEISDRTSCLEHKDRKIEYHCPTHSFFGCHACFFKHQKSCKDVQFIPEVSENIEASDEYRLFNEMLTNLETKCTQLVSEVKGEKEVIATRYAVAKTGMNEFKRDVLEALHERDHELFAKADKVKRDEIGKVTEVAEKFNNILMETKTIASTTELLKKKQQHCELYITMIQSKEKLRALEKDLQATHGNVHSTDFSFFPNQELLEMLRGAFGLGRLGQTETITKVGHVRDTDVKTASDGGTCRLVSSVLLSNQTLAIVDFNNNKVKIIDTNINKVVSELKVSCGPYAVCYVSEEHIAVTLPSAKKVAVVRVYPSLAVDRTFAVNGTCRGVAYSDGKFVVSFDSNKVEVLDALGLLLKKIETDEHGKSFFDFPAQIAVKQESKLIYISNYNSNNVLCMTFDGTVVARYEDQELQGPWQIVVSRRQGAFVCGYKSNNIYQIADDCRKGKLWLTSADGLNKPESVSYNENKGELFIGQMDCNVLKLFRVMHASL